MLTQLTVLSGSLWTQKKSRLPSAGSGSRAAAATPEHHDKRGALFLPARQAARHVLTQLPVLSGSLWTQKKSRFLSAGSGSTII
ncbi:hypothetical protein [Bacillus atrophaeus]|uniref:hypothetical protein n=1 Tax=Bacillus atrophaeus TaxID=1452 RepID=UPI002E1A8765|nr:hypothetical protein [Bacillus atrophaeus]MED1032541.1 hypothetical protein [Bacillus atrophaeus]